MTRETSSPTVLKPSPAMYRTAGNQRRLPRAEAVLLCTTKYFSNYQRLIT
jgi:hypothetical protein